MTKDRILYQVDAFTAEPFKGNPAGVCILDEEMPDEWMQRIAMELHVSETAFITGGADVFKIRFFTPESEIPLCGHATLSSAHIMFETGLAAKNTEINFSSKAGLLKVAYSDGLIVMNFPVYDVKPAPVPSDIGKYLGMGPTEFFRTEHGWTLAFFESEEDVINLNPDFRAMKDTEYGDIIVTSLSSDPDFDFCVRCFVPAMGIDEDPVTGSAHCALAPFWHSRTGRKVFRSHQVSKRGGILNIELIGDRVKIAGFAKTIFKAELYV
jgi:PhzF family phenazine biosynthesis protein